MFVEQQQTMDRKETPFWAKTEVLENGYQIVVNWTRRLGTIPIRVTLLGLNDERIQGASVFDLDDLEGKKHNFVMQLDTLSDQVK